jgi:hypothetical protein
LPRRSRSVPACTSSISAALTDRARVDESANDAVYAAIVEPEQNQDTERKGVAVIVDIESVDGFAPDGMFRMER